MSTQHQNPTTTTIGKFAAILSILTGYAIFVGASGCNWQEFGDLSDTTWVHVTKTPGSPDFDRYGEAISVASDSDGLDFFVWGQANDPIADGLAQVHYDSDGSASSTGIIFDGIDPVPSGSILPMQRDATTGVNNVVIGVSQNNGDSGRVLVWSPGNAAPQLGQTHAFDAPITAVAAGLIRENATTSELVAASGSTLFLIADYAMNSAGNDQECAPAGANDIPIGLAWSAEIAGDIAVAMRLEAGTSTVYIVDSDNMAQGGGACDIETQFAAPGGENDFGSQMHIANFAGDSEADLIAAAPSANKVYVFSSEPDPIVINAPPGAGRFGASLATANYSDRVLIIGAPNAEIDGNDNAGAVYLYTYDGASFKLAATLHNARPEADQHFGQAVSVASFGGQDIIIVGADGEIFTYFLNPLNNETDPRE